MSFYRFRSLSSLLGKYKELETQTIYFADPAELNDPMEGLRNIVWKGDEIVWKNLFRHYLFCLQDMCIKYALVGEEEKLEPSQIIAFANQKEFLTEECNKRFTQVVEEFFSNKLIQELIKSLAIREKAVTEHELIFYFSLINHYAVELIFTYVLCRPPANKTQVLEGLSKILEFDPVSQFELLYKTEAPEKVDSLCLLLNLYNEADLLSLKSSSTSISNGGNFLFITRAFPMHYVQQLYHLIYPSWYAACFMSDYKNSSVWGHYAEGHTGVCLIFKSENGTLALNTPCGISSSRHHEKIFSKVSRSNISHSFKKIVYEDNRNEIDFFTSLGRLNIPTLYEMWYRDFQTGKDSKSALEFQQNEANWRNNYWMQFEPDLLRKSQDWSYENEYRLLLHSNLGLFESKENRILTYEFKDLEGLVFGINTPEDKKLEIIKIIRDKCLKENCTDFKFYQAYFNSSDQCINKFLLSINLV